VELGVEFETEVDDLAEAVQTELAAQARLLRKFGPQLGRPRADTLNGSQFANMKELRFSADGGEWRVAFAFDIERSAALLPLLLPFGWWRGTSRGEARSDSTGS
jgi:hypothetical protein